jgi:hypothetical protein
MTGKGLNRCLCFSSSMCCLHLEVLWNKKKSQGSKLNSMTVKHALWYISNKRPICFRRPCLNIIHFLRDHLSLKTIFSWK